MLPPVHSGWEDIEEALRLKKAPKEQNRMMQQEVERRRQEGIDPGRSVSPQEFFSQPEVLQKHYADTIKRLTEYPDLLKSLLEIPADVLKEVVERNHIGDAEWTELKATLNAAVDQVKAFNAEISHVA